MPNHKNQLLRSKHLPPLRPPQQIIVQKLKRYEVVIRGEIILVDATSGADAFTMAAVEYRKNHNLKQNECVISEKVGIVSPRIGQVRV